MHKNKTGRLLTRRFLMNGLTFLKIKYFSCFIFPLVTAVDLAWGAVLGGAVSFVSTLVASRLFKG
jgi:hypothetical protein